MISTESKLRLGLVGIVALYLVLGTIYAVRTPPWQAPDEPAHFNYVRHLAQGFGLPVLRQGDYNYDYLERLKAAKFPESLSIDSIRYEFHQPPLYYLLASPLLALMGPVPGFPQVVGLRLFSVFWGALLLVLAYAIVSEVFPQAPWLRLAVPGLVALVPQHVAMSAAINNDTLAEAVLAALLLMLLRALKESIGGQKGVGLRLSRTTWGLGVLLGLAFLTKITTYGAVGLVAYVLVYKSAEARRWKGRLGQFLIVMAIALVISVWWFARNALVYGLWDILGLQRHAQVVMGQPTPGGFDLAAAKGFVVVSFKSFWAQLGWMGVPADGRMYAFLALICGVALVGLILFGIRVWRQPTTLTQEQRAALGLLALSLLFTLGLMLAYNLQFIQPQGRYLFPALIPISLFLVMGLREWLHPRYEGLAYALGGTGLLLFNVYAIQVLLPYLR